MILDRLVGIFGLLFALAIAARVYIVWRRIGQLPIMVHGADTAHDFAHHMLALIIGLEAIEIIAFRLQAYFPRFAVYDFLMPFEAMRLLPIQGAGLMLAFAGLVWTVTAQVQMGASWRIGNDKTGNTELVSHGLYAVSRHPIYVGFVAIAIGLFLATPNLVTLLCAVMTPVILAIIARLEEEFQIARHGDFYRVYMSRTRRWL
jgi:protein-S-isoprenylcysteine O-methyltransferase Ste14